MRQATKDEIDSLPYKDAFTNGSLELFYTSEEDAFMKLALTARLKSSDKQHPTGAVIVNGETILASDSNQSGFKHTFLIRLHELGWCMRRWLKIQSGQKYWLCPGCAKFYDHAEGRATRIGGRDNSSMMRGSTLYLAGHWWCCKPCSDEMIGGGIKKVVLLEGAKTKYGR